MKRSLLFLLLQLTGIVVFPQYRHNTITFICEDTCTKKKHSVFKPSWHPYAGIHISGDAEMFYLGPSFQAGIDYQLRKRIVLSAYLHYFSKKVDHVEYGGYFEHGKFKTFTGALLFQGNTGKSQKKGFFLAGGVALQRWRDNYNNNYDSWDNKRTTLIPDFRLGYFFPVDHNKMSIELNGTGPYSYADNTTISPSRVTEILTQLSLGMRFIL